MIIDAHVHLYPPEVAADPAGWAAAAGEGHWAALATRRRRDGRPVQTFPTVDELLRVMDEAGVDRAVLLGWYWETPASCAAQNRFYAACVRAHADRLSAFATVHPGAGGPATLEQMRRARGDDLIGLGELSPHSQGFGVDDPVFAEVLALAGDLGWPVNLHVTDPASRPYPGRVETPLADFLWLARTYPKTTFVLAHWGGRPSRAEDRSELACLENVYYDTAASPLIYGSAVWPDALRACGAGRVLFGSDYPLNLYPQSEVAPALARFVAEARAGGADVGVMGRNAASLMRL